MPTSIIMKVGEMQFSAELNDSDAAKELIEKLPLTVKMGRWGEEFYGNCGLSTGLSEDSREEVELGELAVWPPAQALCIFFGTTPASIDDKPRAASAVNPIGKLHEDPKKLKNLGNSVTVEIKRA